jgi:ClpX C4-type zinc finger
MSFWKRQPERESALQLILSCSCGSSQRKVKKLISGPGVYICDSCAGRAQSVMAGHGDGPAGTPIGTIQLVSDCARAERCSFCGKHRHQVAAMASAGGMRIICGECLELCNEILTEELPEAGHKRPPSTPETPGQGITEACAPVPTGAATPAVQSSSCSFCGQHPPAGTSTVGTEANAMVSSIGDGGPFDVIFPAKYFRWHPWNRGASLDRQRVPLQKYRDHPDLRILETVHAARWYSLITPPSTLRRHTGASNATTTGSS